MIFRFMNSQNAKRARGPEETIFVDLNQEKDDPFGFSQTMRDRDPRTKTYPSGSILGKLAKSGTGPSGPWIPDEGVKISKSQKRRLYRYIGFRSRSTQWKYKLGLFLYGIPTIWTLWEKFPKLSDNICGMIRDRCVCGKLK